MTRELIDRYELPPQPAKKTDARYQQFLESYGNEVVELDALEPDVLMNMVEYHVEEYFDEDYYEGYIN